MGISEDAKALFARVIRQLARYAMGGTPTVSAKRKAKADCELVVSPRMRRAEAVENCRFSVVQIRQLQNHLATCQSFVPIAHIERSPCAVMHNRSVKDNLAR